MVSLSNKKSIRRKFKKEIVLRKRNRRLLMCKKRKIMSPTGGIFSEVDVAHSADPENGIYFTQSYHEHSTEVKHRALKCFDEMKKYVQLDDKMIIAMREILEMATEYHDIGKLDVLAQKIIKGGHKKKMLNHVDAGTAVLLNKYAETSNTNYLIAAILIDAHHLGILNKILNENRQEDEKRKYPDFLQAAMFHSDVEGDKKQALLRSDKKVMEKYSYYKSLLLNDDETVSEYVDRTLSILLKRHNRWIENSKKSIESAWIPIHKHPMFMRILLSCLVEGDHWDTCRHYGGISPDVVTLPMRASERLIHHMNIYNNFEEPKTNMEKRKNKVRTLIHKDCEEFELTYNFYGIYAYPSYGKTLSGSYLSVRLCDQFNMRGIVYMAPYNNILVQNVKELEKFFVIDKEQKGEVVGEHYCEAHHWDRAKDSGMNYKLLKHYSTLWNCPLEIVSVVQFFETMASNYPSKIRKLHQLVGRVIIIDEFHTAVPIKMLRQTLKWLKYLTEVLGCKIIFMSGSPVKFWEIEILKSCNIKVGEVLSKKSTKAMNELEVERVRYSKINDKFDSFKQLSKRVIKESGPRVIVFNTVISAAMFANYLRLHYGREKVEHLSTALTPKDRKRKYKHIINRLKNKEIDNDWCLVATSCIETGVNFSFQAGFRENNCYLSTFQLGGRVNREHEYDDCCDVFVFDLDHDKIGTTNNPAFYTSMKVQNKLFAENKIGYKYCTEAIRRELIDKNTNQEHLKQIEVKEEELCFGSVTEMYKIIPYAYKSIVVDPEIIDKIEKEEIVQYWELSENSVQIFFTKLDRTEYCNNITFMNEDSIPNEKYREAKVKAPKEFNIWTGEYDPDFLGYMKDILKSLNHNVDY